MCIRDSCEGLHDHGFDAIPIGSGRKAASLLESDSFDAVVTDLRMPEVDGMTLLKLSRRLAPERPVLMMTAHGAIDSAIESIRQGAAHYLTKPFKLEELVIFLHRALEESRSKREASTLLATLRARSGRSALTVSYTHLTWRPTSLPACWSLRRRGGPSHSVIQSPAKGALTPDWFPSPGLPGSPTALVPASPEPCSCLLYTSRCV